ncbi:MAG: hypothetical protein HZB38_16840 [Planctomycetes bacterium]|nr:hypothetical protein [Planctomycetota bacterium]
MRFALFVASGTPFLFGMAICALAPIVGVTVETRGLLVALILLGIGWLLVSISATPINAVLLVALCVATPLWIIAQISRFARTYPRVRHSTMIVFPALSLTALALESCSRFLPRLPSGGETRLCVIGDSLSAGIGNGVSTWPELIGKQNGIEVRNLASAGATTSTGRRQADSLPDDAGVVLILIGGNDILQRRPDTEFEQDLTYIVEAARRRARSVVLFEIPAPPLQGQYIAAQRRVAARAGARLVPRRVLTSLLALPGTTSDGLHLTKSGQAALADQVWSMIHSAFSSKPAN